jgi:hypothetical protein
MSLFIGRDSLGPSLILVGVTLSGKSLPSVSQELRAWSVRLVRRLACVARALTGLELWRQAFLSSPAKSEALTDTLSTITAVMTSRPAAAADIRGASAAPAGAGY